MAKSTRKEKKKGVSAKKAKKSKKASEYVNCLKELHKLEGVLLTEVGREIG